MFVPSNLLVNILPYFKEKLHPQYPIREIETMFQWLCQDKYSLSKFELKTTELRLSESELLYFRSVVKRLQNKEPIQYIIGNTEFYNSIIYVSSAVLIPRPETEELVDWILEDFGANSTLLDIGTGSGCIPIAISKQENTTQAYAVDISQEALSIAQKSATLNKVDITFKQKNILTETINDFPELDIIVSNPPYVLESDKTKMAENVLDFEPHIALFVEDTDPLLFYKRIAELALNQLKNNGQLYFEIHERFATQTIEMLTELGFQDIQLRKDLQGKDRMTRATLLK